MKLLALDAATEACSVAIKTEETIFEYFEVCPQQHSQKLLPAVEHLLSEAALTLSDLDAIIYGAGPGSFTGVRIGVAITQGLAFGANLPVIGVSNLALMAQQAIDELNAEQVVCAIDARMSEVYFAIYNNENGIATLVGKEAVTKPNQIKLSNVEVKENAVAVGTGWQTYAEELSALIPCRDSDITLPDIKYAFKLVEKELSENQGQSAEFAQPNYVRDEVTWQKLPGRK